MAAYFRCPVCLGAHPYPTLDRQGFDDQARRGEALGIHCPATGRSMSINTSDDMFWKDEDPPANA